MWEVRRYLLVVITAIAAHTFAYSQPAGYYSSAEGKTGEELQQALHDIIDGHTVLSYAALWTAFYTTDDRPDGTVWDMYSDVPDGPNYYNYDLGDDQCGNYSGEGSCYNREHSFPKSWFGDAAPMNSDLFHLYPTDGYTNGRRGNYPFGETSSPTWTSQNGSKVGPCVVAGYNGTVFEPIDEYKGDFSRTYFYMATRYYGEDAGWSGSPMVDGAQPKAWARAMLIQWHTDDPVSAKEVERNDAVYALQDNRNPFIDHPEYVLALYEEGNIDEIAPELDSVVVFSADSLVLWFNEDIDPESAGQTSGYQLSSEAAVEAATMLSGQSKAVGLKVSGLNDGTYTLIINGLTDTSGNAMAFAVYSFTVDLLYAADLMSGKFLVYPNPNEGSFHIKFGDEAQKIKNVALFDVSGRFHPVDQYDTGEFIQVKSSSEPGIYTLWLQFEGGLTLHAPLIIQ